MKQQQTKTHYILHVLLALLIILVFTTLIYSASTSALSYQSNVNINFTLNPTISLTLSSRDLTIENLAPGNSDDSNIITVGVSTNSGYGYYLSATANTQAANANLVNEVDESSFFANLNANSPSLSDFPDNTWGYSYCNSVTDCSSSTNWVSGDAGSAVTGYNGLPLDNNDSGSTGIKLLNPNSYASSGSVQFKIGAKAANTQAAGTYNGTVNFYAVATPNPEFYMQDINSAGLLNLIPNIHDTTILIDKRDERAYHITKLKDDKYWMIDNLALDILNPSILDSLTTDNTNADSISITSLRYGNRTSGAQYAASGVTNWNTANRGNSNNTPKINNESKDVAVINYGSGFGKVGIYYNFCAASAGSYCYDDPSEGDARYDICPRGWRLPTSEESQKLNSSYSVQDSFYNAFSITLSGIYSYGDPMHQNVEMDLWTKTRYDASQMYKMVAKDLAIYPTTYYHRRIASSIRCVFSDE